MIYQSPIALTDKDVFPIRQEISIKGKNKGATYIDEDKIFLINSNDKIILKIDGNKYQLIEYHFHTPSEHTINKKEYPAEIHYVFYKLDGEICHKKHHDICGKCSKISEEDETILVIGRVIKNYKCSDNLSKLQVDIPSTYFEYDGSLTGEGDEGVPVRWIVGEKYIRLSLKEIEKFTKTSKPIQPLDNRIILHSC